MRVSLKICMFGGVFALLAGVFLSQAHAASDDPVVVIFGKQSVQVSPQPRIDIGEDGPDPHKVGAVGVSGQVVSQDVLATQDAGTSRRNGANRYEALQQFLRSWFRQLFL